MNSTSVPDYDPLTLKGAGAFGYVIEAYDRNRDIRVAIKRTHKVGTKLSREYAMLSELKECEYIVKLLDAFYTSNEEKKVIQNLVFEFVPSTLDKYINKHKLEKKIIPIEKIKKLTKQILLGLNYCHKKNIMHRDLKPENILITEDEKIKICDFGSSKNINKNNVNNKSTPYITTRYYRAPELYLGKINYDSKVDIFALGCVMAELFSLSILFPGINDGMQIFEYMNIIGLPDVEYLKELNVNKKIFEIINLCKDIEVYPLNEILDPDNQYNKNDIDDACDLLYNMLNWDHNKRFSAEQCLAHNFFKNVNLNDKKVQKKFEFKKN
jgi:glycogen synthase kinase 3 beta